MPVACIGIQERLYKTLPQHLEFMKSSDFIPYV